MVAYFNKALEENSRKEGKVKVDIVVCKFIGKSSLGFVHGESYLLTISTLRSSVISIRGNLMFFGAIPANSTSQLNCDYGSFEAFLKNWRLLNHITEGPLKQSILSEIREEKLKSIL